jgi:hypothetical protein
MRMRCRRAVGTRMQPFLSIQQIMYAARRFVLISHTCMRMQRLMRNHAVRSVCSMPILGEAN